METRIERNSNIELLRIISMVFIVMGHYVDQTSFLKFDFKINDIIGAYFGGGARIATNVFLIISVWYLNDIEFNGKKLVKMYFQLCFYSVALTSVSLFAGTNVGMKEIIRGYIPFFGRALWFVSAYITLYLFTPVLKKFFLLPYKLQRNFCVISFISVCIVASFPELQDGYLIDSIWFIFVFLWVGYIKAYTKNLHISSRYCLLAGIAMYFVMVGMHYVGCTYDTVILFDICKRIGSQYLYDIKTLPNFLCALLIFYFCINLKQRYNVIINKIAKYSFTVYLFHQVPAFIPILWSKVIKAEVIQKTSFSSFFIPFVAFIVYLIAMVIDILRKIVIEKNKNYNKLVEIVGKKINNLFFIK